MIRLAWLAPLVLSACFELPPGDHEPAGVTRDVPATTPLPASLTHPGTRRATTLLTALPIRPQEPHTGYARDQFGPPWADADRNGCDTRNDVLRRDLDDPRFGADQPSLRGALGQTRRPLHRHRDPLRPRQWCPGRHRHVVALGNAWATGAAHWPFKKRIALANDPLNLLAAQAAANRAKSDGDAATWLPPDRGYHCTYVARQLAVKTKYELWVSQAEHDAMAKVLRACPDQLAPTGDAPTLAPIDPPEPPRHAAKQSEPPAKATPATPARDPSYGSCKQAKAHHAGPYVARPRPRVRLLSGPRRRRYRLRVTHSAGCRRRPWQPSHSPRKKLRACLPRLRVRYPPSCTTSVGSPSAPIIRPLRSKSTEPSDHVPVGSPLPGSSPRHTTKKRGL